MNNGLLILKNPGFTVPKSYANLALSTHRSCFGYAIVKDHDTDQAVIIGDTSREVPSLEDFLAFMEQTKSDPALFFLGNFDTEFNDSDIQPFLYNEGDKTLLAIGLEGSFPDFNTEGATEAKNLLDELLVPSLNDNYKIAGGDIAQFLARLEEARFVKALANEANPRGAYSFLTIGGDFVATGKNDLGDEFEWGIVSQHHGYQEAQQQVETPAPEPEKKGIFGKVMATAKAVVSTAPKSGAEIKAQRQTPKEVPPTQSKTVTEKTTASAIKAAPKIEAPATATAVRDPAPEGYAWVVCPTNLQGKPRKAWIRKMSGNDKLPPTWNEADFAVLVKSKATLADLDKHVKVDAPKPEVQQPSKHAGQKVAAKIDVTSKTIDNNVLSAAAKSGVQDMLLKHLDANSNTIINPMEIQALEAKLPSFTEQMGITLRDIFNMSPEFKRELCMKYPEAMYLAFSEVVRYSISKSSEEEILGKAESEFPKKEDAPAKPSVPASPAPAVEPAQPVAKRGNPFGKRAIAA